MKLISSGILNLWLLYGSVLLWMIHQSGSQSMPPTSLPRFLPCLAMALSVSACTGLEMTQFRVVSNPPGAQVDVDGVSAGTTPTQISLGCSRRWVGVMEAPGG